MTWLVWRQHRAEALVMGLLVVAIGIALLLLGLPMHRLFPLGADHCAVPPLDDACRSGLTHLQRNHAEATPILILLNLVPFGIGAFIGAPLLAREVEGGTWQLAWTQAIPRTRWLTVKLASLGVFVVLVTAIFSAVTSWFRQPLDLFGRFDITGFDVSGIVPPAYALFAFALGIAVGVLTQRSLPALGIALVAFVVARATVAGWLRPIYQTPRRLDEVFPARSDGRAFGTGNLHDGILDQGFSDANGARLGELAVTIMEHRAQEAGTDPATYLHNQGIHRWISYQPADRYWTFQLVEAGIFVGLATILLFLVIVRVRRRAF